MLKQCSLTLLLGAALSISVKAQSPNTMAPENKTMGSDTALKADEKYTALQNEIQKLKAEQRTQQLKAYAHDWQQNRGAQAPHILARKLKIEKDALKDGFTVEDMKRVLEEEKKAKKAAKKK